MLEVIGLHKAYAEHTVLRGVDLTVRPGQILGLVGSNGAGKTTLISIAAGLRPATSGSVRVCGLDISHRTRQAQQHIGLAPQELGIYPTLTTAENLRFFARLAGLAGAAARTRVSEVAQELELTGMLSRKAGELSGGQKRRLHTALAVLHRPAVLFLDEPTVGADVQSRAGILDVVRCLARDGAAIVYTTHYLTELDQLRADVAVLHAGRIVAAGPLDELVARFASTSVTLHFDGVPPALAGWEARGSSLVLETAVPDPAEAIARALAGLGTGAARLTNVDISRPSLERAYLALTGRGDGEDSNAVAA